MPVPIIQLAQTPHRSNGSRSLTLWWYYTRTQIQHIVWTVVSTITTSISVCLNRTWFCILNVYYSVLIDCSFILFFSRGGSSLCSLTRLIRDSPQAAWRKMPGRSATLSPWALKCSAPSHSPRTLASTVSGPWVYWVVHHLLEWEWWRVTFFVLSFNQNYVIVRSDVDKCRLINVATNRLRM